MLLGEYRHQLDAKNRIRMPAKLKAGLGERYLITKGSNHCLYVFPEAEMEKLGKKLAKISPFDMAAQKPLRLLLSSCCEAEEDNQGRVMIPQNLRSFANLTKDIVVIGSGTHAEIWSAEAWDAYNDEEDFDSVIGVLADIDMED